jgi:hypothetical protein
MGEFKVGQFIGALFLLALGGVLVWWGGQPEESGVSKTVGFFTDFVGVDNPAASGEPWSIKANWQTIVGFVAGVAGLGLLVATLVQAAKKQPKRPYRRQY